jgi:hypothetical protein
VLDRARADHIRVRVVETRFDAHTLRPLVDRLLARRVAELTTRSISNDCSGIEVGLAKRTAAAEARVRAAIHSPVPLHFTQVNPIAARSSPSRLIPGRAVRRRGDRVHVAQLV